MHINERGAVHFSLRHELHGCLQKVQYGFSLYPNRIFVFVHNYQMDILFKDDVFAFCQQRIIFLNSVPNVCTFKTFSLLNPVQKHIRHD